jgi:hypothetical protein
LNQNVAPEYSPAGAVWHPRVGPGYAAGCRRSFGSAMPACSVRCSLKEHGSECRMTDWRASDAPHPHSGPRRPTRVSRLTLKAIREASVSCVSATVIRAPVVIAAFKGVRLAVALVALAWFCLSLGSFPPILRKGSTHIVRFLELALPYDSVDTSLVPACRARGALDRDGSAQP